MLWTADHRVWSCDLTLRTPSTIIVRDHDPAWPRVFQALRNRLTAALRRLAIEIHHVGSTAVPGLAAKPIIDIDVVIAAASDLPRVAKRLAVLDYVDKGEQGVAGRRAFRPPADVPAHHLYVCTWDSPELARHLAFRNHLRADPAACAAYAQLKRALAERFGSDREGYTAAKTTFVEAALRGGRSILNTTKSGC